ncbi:MAG: YciI family protein [Thermoplasmata archaeon]
MYVVETTSFVKSPSDEMKKIHREYLLKMLNSGKLKLAGRMVDNTGSFLVWEAETVEEARALASSDPYFSNGLTTFILKGWSIFWNGFVKPPIIPRD